MRRLAAVVASLVLVACTSNDSGVGPAGSTTSTAPSLAPAGGPIDDAAVGDKLRHAVRQFPGGLVVADGEGVVLYGGGRPREAADGPVVVDDSVPTDRQLVSSLGAFIAADGTRRSFRTDVALVEASAVTTADTLFLTGKACTGGTADYTDTGVYCSPGTPALLLIDRATLAVEEVPLDLPAATADAQDVWSRLHPYGAGAVLNLLTGTTSRAFLVSSHGSTAELPTPPGGIACSNGDVVLAGDDRRSKAPSIVRLDADGTRWTALPTPAVGFTRGNGVDCTAGGFIRNRYDRDDGSIDVLATSADRWRAIDTTAGTYVAWSNARATVAAISTDEGHRLLDPTTGVTTPVTVTSDIGAPVVLTDAGRLVALTPDLTLVSATEPSEDPP